ncbi:sensor histidine kinase [Paenibacillus ehimensis]|uniref:histidine kinase n=1 Tax=Paenibacillus ehimensis TaxID=79264 RepID=A0ABT8V4P2_9BACL|nr:HAMP domain-containing sensor histidine kinase [Paenibacillus ehimensis]MDO3676411.1 HAMP domain-containing sensor histidine kinase [Paenibacillus ehimensis]
MSLRTRLMLLSGLWILLIVVFFNWFIYYYILKKTTDNEVRQLWNKAQIILRDTEIYHPANWNPGQLQEYLEPDSLIRIISPDGAVRTQVSTSEELSAHPAIYRTQYHTVVRNELGLLILFIQVPIVGKSNVQIGLLELGKGLNVIAAFMELLVAGLTMTTGSVLLFSPLVGFFYTKALIRPIRQLLETMRTIRSKGDFILLSSQFTAKKDELGELGRTFNEMIVRLQENDRRQKHFVADASHELKTPLTVIESYTSLLRRWGGRDPAIRQEALNAIHSETVRLKGLIDALLRLAEVERHAETELHPVRIAELIRSTAEQMRRAFGRNIIVRIDAEETECSGDEARLKQLLIILLDNAIKYSQEDVIVECGEEERCVVIRVIDRGMGIPSGELPLLFERFYRVDKARSRGTGGSGLGLAIAKQIVELHQGLIRLDSEEGKGTTATVKLPKSSLRAFQ